MLTFFLGSFFLPSFFKVFQGKSTSQLDTDLGIQSKRRAKTSRQNKNEKETG